MTADTPTCSSDTAALIRAIEVASKDPSCSGETLLKLYEIRDREIARTNELAFDTALAAAQAEMRPVSADMQNAKTGSKYASYAALDRKIRPIYTSHGFAISFNTGDSKTADHTLVLAYATCRGHRRTYQFDMPNEPGADTTRAQAAGGAASYGMRYLLKMIFNIAVGEDDRDGNDYERISAGQVTKLRKLITVFGANESSLLSYLKLEQLADIPADRFTSVARAIRQRGKPAARRKPKPDAEAA